MNTPNSLTNVLRKKALTNCIEILPLCLHALLSINETTLERHVNTITECHRNCEKALASLDGNPGDLQNILHGCVKSCKACMNVCKEIELDLFKKAMVALKDCIVELNSDVNPVKDTGKLVRR
ncbi:MAG TPA: hypothetical protein VIM65_10320 [Cyclobacteriaceae bacterium]